MIFFKDYLREEINPSAESSPQSAFLNSESTSIVDFPAQGPSEGCTREEIGKWVDKLMAMPDDADELRGSLESVEDPFLAVASKMWSEEIS